MEKGTPGTLADLDPDDQALPDLIQARTGLSTSAVLSVLWQAQRAGWAIVRIPAQASAYWRVPGGNADYIPAKEWNP